MNSILTKIATQKRFEVDEARRINPLLASDIYPPLPLRNFTLALQHPHPAIIAEIKKASPSKGIIREDFQVENIAQIYEKHGARCLSVLTDISFFQGHPNNILIAKQQVQCPVLRKDFIIDSYQINESLVLGADCVLLIVALLDDIQLHDFCQQAQQLGMQVLVESHDAHELERALKLPTLLMGINNRSLHHFNTDIQISIELAKHIPKDRILISESGINHREDIQLLEEHGIHHFLIGESLMRESDIGVALDKLLGRKSSC